MLSRMPVKMFPTRVTLKLCLKLMTFLNESDQGQKTKVYLTSNADVNIFGNKTLFPSKTHISSLRKG